ncbi:GH1 family beta-glucosidase [Salinispira pacifica]
MRTLTFPSDFLWGTASASYQVEGAVDIDGRGPSIWDSFSRTPGRTSHAHTGDRGTDHYHRYREDVALMRDLGARAYRFSIAWPRIFPEGAGRRNPKGFDFYKRLIDELAGAGIEPVVSLYHWDLPQPLQDQGGWPNRETAYRFLDYAQTCFDELHDRVSTWITVNEPFCAAFLGYLHGIHAPGLRDRRLAYEAAHHLNLAHGLGVDVFRSGGYPGRIGTALNLITPRPATRHEKDVEAADRMADQATRMFLDPLFGKGYPERHLRAYPEIRLPVKEGDLELIAARVDFLGLNYYNEAVAAYDPDAPEGFREVPQYAPVTDMGWPIVPWGLYRQLRFVHENYGAPEIYITENGCAFADRLSESGTRCHDPERIGYLSDHFEACSAALREGVKLRGYFLWSFIDNFEWSFGYTKRFGIVYCDYVDQRRVPKDSYYFYRDVIAGHEGPYGHEGP